MALMPEMGLNAIRCITPTDPKSLRCCQACPLNMVVVIDELDIAWSLPVASDKFVIASRSLIERVARQHALDAHAYALCVLNWAPALAAQKVEADDSIRVNVWMHGYRAVRRFIEGDLGWLCETGQVLS